MDGQTKQRIAAFAEQVGPQAQRVAAAHGVPVDAVIGQWGLETGWGKSVIPGTNNYGNIKDFSGGGVGAKDNMTGSVDKYRQYADANGFADDFTKLLGNRRYAGVKGAKDDQSYFTALKAGGYAEDPDYVAKGTRAAAMVAAARNGGVLPSGEVPKVEGATERQVSKTLQVVAPVFQRAEQIIKDTTHLSILGDGQATKSSKPVEIPKDVPWSKPQTVAEAAKPGGERMMVTYVGDGDGLYLKNKDGKQVECRIDSVDAPETAKPKHDKPGQPFGEESKRILKDMIENQEVTVRITRAAVEGAKDKSRRNYCQIELEGQNIDKELLRKGAAWLYRRYNNDPELAKIEAEAKQNKTGLWADPNAENPEAFRRRIERK